MSPLRIYLACDAADQEACAALHKLLAPLERDGQLIVWHVGCPLAGQDLAVVQRAERERADLHVALLSPDFLNNPEADLLLRAQTPLLAVLLRACAYDVTGYRDRRVLRAAGPSEAALAALLPDLRREIAALRPAAPPTPAPLQLHGASAETKARLYGMTRPEDPRGLDCDRSEQWATLLQNSPMRGSLIYLLPGDEGQGHRFFLLRLCTGLPKEHPHRVLLLHLGPRRGRYDGDYRTLLADALGCEGPDLVPRLRQVLATQTLYLLHDPQREVHFDRDLCQLFTHGLPHLLKDIGPTRFGLKVLQPLTYAPAGRLLRSLARLLPYLRAAEAQRVLARCRALAADHSRGDATRAPLPIYLLDELTQIKDDHVFKFLDGVDFRGDRRAFLKAVMSGAETSEQIIERLLQQLPPGHGWQPGPPQSGDPP